MPSYESKHLALPPSWEEPLKSQIIYSRFFLMSSRRGSTRRTYFAPAAVYVVHEAGPQPCADVGQPYSADLFFTLLFSWIFGVSRKLVLFHVFTLDCVTVSCSTRPQFLHRFFRQLLNVSFNATKICTSLYLPSEETIGGINPAGETCWKSSFQLLSPLHNPPLVPCFPSSFFICFSFFFNRCLFSVRVLRSVAGVICSDTASTRFV